MAATARELLARNDIDAAIAAQTDLVRNKPADAQARALLAELFCLSGQWEKADRQLDLVGTQHTELALGVALFRQLVRGAIAREEVFAKGAVPEMIGGATQPLQAALAALLDLRDGNAESASNTLREAEAKRTPLSGSCDEKPFADLRDGDDVTAGVLEVISSTGKYFWVPFDRLTHLELEKPKSIRDRLWRQATIEVRDGPDGVVYIPALYPILPTDTVAPEARLGRLTDWIELPGGAMRGVGLRTFLIGEEGATIDEITSLSVSA